MSMLFSPLRLRDVTFKNRVFVSPMCQYSSEDGLPTDWHLVHLGSRAVGGAALVMVEATAVSPEGRISPWDSGMWSDVHAAVFQRLVRFVKEQGSVPAIQLAHAGRKASTDRPWHGGKGVRPEDGGWQPIAPTAEAFAEGYPVPREMTKADVDAVVAQFRDAARRSLDAGFEVVEIHMAHGYLLHEFLSPLTNRRTDDYGSSLANRMRLPLRVARAVREVWPDRLPLFARLSCIDWVEGGWDLPQSIELSRRLKEAGVDLIDCSSGGIVPYAKIELGPGYQVPFAEAIRREAGLATGAVGMITEPRQAEQIVLTGQADAVLLARALLRDPYWPLHAAQELGTDLEWAVQYARAKVTR
jgi:2,4-dienoyl-CoA reductase-like NADH-dependent reductase (Old Yellow Enzyme family)